MDNNNSSSEWQSGVHIDELPDSCLDHIFAKLPLKDKFCAVPYICKRWKKIADESRTMWSEFRMDRLWRLGTCNLESMAHRTAAVAWFKQHGHAINHLTVDSNSEAQIWEDLLNYMMPYSAASLRTIDISREFCVDPVPDSLFVSLASCTQLKSFSLWASFDDYEVIWKRNKLHALSLLRDVTSVTFRRMEHDQPTYNTSFPPVLLSMTQLRELSVSAETWPEDFRGLPNLHSLTLSSVQEPIPTHITELSNLQRLEIECEWVSLGRGDTVFPPCIAKLRALEHLELIRLPKSNLDLVGGLTTLTSLSLRGCELSDFPNCISKLSKLQALLLVDKSITVIPDWIVGLPCLQRINLQNNCFDTLKLPKCLTQLTMLTTLLVNHNCKSLAIDNGTDSLGHQLYIVWECEINVPVKRIGVNRLWPCQDDLKAVISYLNPRLMCRN